MEENSLIFKSISTLKQRLINNGGFIEIQLENGQLDKFGCSFKSPAIDEEWNELIEKIGPLPIDYLALFKLCNGCSLFDHPLYGGENHIFSLSEVLEYNRKGEAVNWLKIAYIYGDYIVINMDKVRNNQSHYLFVTESTDPFEYSRELYCNFETWLERFIITNGNKYWNWGAEPYKY